jgi:23S rRNA pseudoU1915 N3-methylase RlmH
LGGDESDLVLNINDFTKLLKYISPDSLMIVKDLERKHYSSERFLKFMDLMTEALSGDLQTEIKGEDGYVFDIFHINSLLKDFHSTYQEIKAAKLQSGHCHDLKDFQSV